MVAKPAMPTGFLRSPMGCTAMEYLSTCPQTVMRHLPKLVYMPSVEIDHFYRSHLPYQAMRNFFNPLVNPLM